MKKRLASFVLAILATVAPAVVAIVVLGPNARFDELADGGAGWIVATFVGAFLGGIAAALLRRSEGDSSDSVLRQILGMVGSEPRHPEPKADDGVAT
jgi:peptidoglycan/LPS O-acetylase OafA/YrhL